MENDYELLHRHFNNLKRFTFPYNESEISQNGIYILFETGERYKNFDRIVRIGSHTNKNRLLKRLNEHFVEEDHRDSIFRKHLGRCFLTIDHKSNYIPIWDLKIKRREDKLINLPKINWELESEYEHKITGYIRKNCSFVIIPDLTNDVKRVRLEQGLIATVGQTVQPSFNDKWPGAFHPKATIRNSKLWNIQHINGRQLSGLEMKEILC